jgi:dolichol kinase
MMTDVKGSDPRSNFSLKRELQRKSIHLGMIIIPVWLYVVPPHWALLGLIIATSATVVLDLLRLTDHRLRQFFLRLFRSLIRSHEEEHLLGSTYFMIAALLSVLAFDDAIAVAALTFLIIGDTVAAIVGKRYGKPMYWGKSPQGSLACFASCLIIGAALLDNQWVIVSGALGATVAEALPVPMDDNMRVPIISGLVMQLVAHFLQG